MKKFGIILVVFIILFIGCYHFFNVIDCSDITILPEYSIQELSEEIRLNEYDSPSLHNKIKLSGNIEKTNKYGQFQFSYLCYYIYLTDANTDYVKFNQYNFYLHLSYMPEINSILNEIESGNCYIEINCYVESISLIYNKPQMFIDLYTSIYLTKAN